MSIDVSVTDHIALITINRPERLNAMDAEHYQALSQAWIRDMDLNTGLRMETVVNRMLWSTEDLQEGARAFAEKRPPRFEGRWP